MGGLPNLRYSDPDGEIAHDDVPRVKYARGTLSASPGAADQSADICAGRCVVIGWEYGVHYVEWSEPLL